MRLLNFGHNHVKVAFLSAVLMIIMLGIAAVSIQGVSSMPSEVRQGWVRQLEAMDHLQHAERGHLRSQLIIEQAALGGNTAEGRRAVELFNDQLEISSQQNRELLALASGYPKELEVLQSYATARDQWVSSCRQRIQEVEAGPASANSADSLATIRSHFETMLSHLKMLHESFYEPSVETSRQQVVDLADRIDTRILIALGAGLAMSVFVTRVTVRAIRAQQADLNERTRQREDERQKKEFESRVHRGMEMAQDEDQALAVVGQAIGEVLPDLQTEILLADSSHAHLLQVFTTDSQNRGPGCPVGSPNECPAVRRGAELTFETNTRFDVCPYLKNRHHGPCSAICVPVSIMGQTVGVLHSTGPDCCQPAADTVRKLAMIASKSGERIGVIRAFAKSQAQASRDSLTGLLNRRSLEHAVNKLNQARRPFTVAYGDIDHFKRLNDTHGHETGDRALRIFADVIRTSIRPNDVVSRWGGEEFVVLLPQATADQAAEVLERVRANLTQRLSNGMTPPFTVSFGVCDASFSPNFDQRLRIADEALLRAKSEGRNRVVVAARTSSTEVADGSHEEIQPIAPDEMVDLPSEFSAGCIAQPTAVAEDVTF